MATKAQQLAKLLATAKAAKAATETRIAALEKSVAAAQPSQPIAGVTLPAAMPALNLPPARERDLPTSSGPATTTTTIDPGTPPSKFFVLVNGKWTRPNAPTDGKAYSWNDATGWTASSGAAGPTGNTTVTDPTGNTTVTDLPGAVANVNKNDPGAMQIINDALNEAGLGELTANAWAMWNKGFDINAIMDDPVNGIRASKVYKARFPGMQALKDAGHAISESQYIAKEDADRGLLYQYLGDSAKVYDNHDSLGKIISGFKSTVELQSNLIAAHDSVLSGDPNTVQALKDMYGLTQEDLAAYWLNPDLATTDIQRRSAAGQLAGVSLRTGSGPLSKAQAEGLYNQGITNAQAEQGFTAIGQEGQLKQALPGDPAEVLTQQDLIDAHFGNKADAIAKVNRVRGNRVSEFQAGGDFAASQAGISGLGTANTR